MGVTEFPKMEACGNFMSRNYCPSCFIHWSTPHEPLEEAYTFLCEVCSRHPTEEELLDYQMENLELIKVADYPKVMRRIYRLVKRKQNES